MDKSNYFLNYFSAQNYSSVRPFAIAVFSSSARLAKSSQFVEYWLFRRRGLGRWAPCSSFNQWNLLSIWKPKLCSPHWFTTVFALFYSCLTASDLSLSLLFSYVCSHFSFVQSGGSYPKKKFFDRINFCYVFFTCPIFRQWEKSFLLTAGLSGLFSIVYIIIIFF